MNIKTSSHVAEVVITTIAETFSADPKSIERQTIADDIDGWDSLGHSVLLARLARRLAISIGEDDAAAESVGELIDRLTARVAGVEL
jgi:acyl carrier protein